MIHPDGRFYYRINGDVFNFPEEVTKHAGKEIQPTEEPFATQWAEQAELQAAWPLQELREKRNVLLASSDWTGLTDFALTNEKLAEWKLYRQKLRDLPDGLDTDDKVNAVTWPTKPD